MNSKLALIHRRMQRQSPEQAPAPAEDDLTAAIQRLVDERVDQAMEDRPAKQPARVQQLLDRQFYKPAPATDYRPPKKPMPPFEMTVSQRDHRRRISRMVCKQINGEGPTIEICVMQRDELGGIVRLTASQIEDIALLPDPNPIALR